MLGGEEDRDDVTFLQLTQLRVTLRGMKNWEHLRPINFWASFQRHQGIQAETKKNRRSIGCSTHNGYLERGLRRMGVVHPDP